MAVRCPVCAADPPPGALFCALCGASLAGPSDSSGAGVHLMGLPESVTTVTSVRAARRIPLVVLAALLVAVSGAAWLALSQTGEESAAEVPPESEPPAAPVVPPAEVDDRIEDAPSLDAGTDAGTSTFAGVGGPVFEVSETGWSVVLEQAGSVYALDLDTGQFNDLGFSGAPLFYNGEYLLMTRPDTFLQTDVVAVRPEDPTDVFVLDEPGVPSEADDPFHVWLWDYEDSSYINIQSGETVVDAGPTASFAPFGPVTADVFSPRSGGVYGIVDGEARLLTEGMVLASGPSLMLVEKCTPFFECTSQWLHRSTLEELPWEIPQGVTRTAAILGGDRWLYHVQEDFSASLTEITTGRQVRAGIFVGITPAVSADGNYLARFSSGSLTVQDLTTGEVQVVTGIRSDGSESRSQPWENRMAFVPSELLAGAAAE